MFVSVADCWHRLAGGYPKERRSTVRGAAFGMSGSDILVVGVRCFGRSTRESGGWSALPEGAKCAALGCEPCWSGVQSALLCNAKCVGLDPEPAFLRLLVQRYYIPLVCFPATAPDVVLLSLMVLSCLLHTTDDTIVFLKSLPATYIILLNYHAVFRRKKQKKHKTIRFWTAFYCFFVILQLKF